MSMCVSHQYNRELKQRRRRRQRKRLLKMWLRVSAIIFQLFKVIMVEKCILTILGLNWNQSLRHKKTKLNICHHMLTSSTQLQNSSFHVVERTRTSTKCQKLKKCTCKACRNTVFHCQICKFVGFLLPSSSWLLKLPNANVKNIWNDIPTRASFTRPSLFWRDNGRNVSFTMVTWP